MLVLSVTHQCDRGCFYCSNPTGQRDVVVANDCLARTEQDVLREAAWSHASSACITGGEPLLRMERTCRYIRALKNAFGSQFHIHLYTSRVHASMDQLRELRDSGLDEIRFHLHDGSETTGVSRAMDFSWTVGIEVPAIPGGHTEEIVEAGRRLGVAFVNLNEFCFFPGFAEIAQERGWTLHEPLYTKVPQWTDENPATLAAVYGQPLLRIRGSKELGLKLVGDAAGSATTVHFCGAGSKYYVQLPRRLARRARRVRWAAEEVTKKGTLLSGRLQPPSSMTRNDLVQRMVDEGLTSLDALLVPRGAEFVIAPWPVAVAVGLGSRSKREPWRDVQVSLFERYPLPPGAVRAPELSVYVFEDHTVV
jgi:pyruvate formate-lyase activating enzyme-like uncharacterized protein